MYIMYLSVYMSAFRASRDPPFYVSANHILHTNKHTMGWLRLVDSLKLQVSFAKEPYKRDYILQEKPIILRSLLIVATPYIFLHV